MITHLVQLPFTSNTSQKCLMFFLKILRSRLWYFIRNLFKYFLHHFLIGTTTPIKIIFQYIHTSVYSVIIDTNRNKRNCCIIIWNGSSTTKFCCIIWLIILFVVVMQSTYLSWQTVTNNSSSMWPCKSHKTVSLNHCPPVYHSIKCSSTEN